MVRKAKIVATLGPSSQTEEKLRQMIQAGLGVARLNFSHGTHADHSSLIQMLRQLSHELGQPITILQDLQGPKIRVGEIPQGTIELSAGENIILTSVGADPGDITEAAPGIKVVTMDFPGLPRYAQPGSQILLDDGQIELKTIRVGDEWVEARVVIGGTLSSHKGVNLPGVILPIPGFTEKDREDLAFGLQEGVDAVAISFVYSEQDIKIVRQAIAEIAPGKGSPLVIAKLERPEALDNLIPILEIADGVMVARGDLGVEMSPARVPIAQKTIIEAANQYGKVVITATQMLESMIHNPRPTRAEASDVANAVFDGSDALMLSAETASGKYPVESIAMMDAIIRQAEEHSQQWGHCQGTAMEPIENDAIALTQGARELAHDRNVAAIAVFSVTGRTALLMSKARPRVPILAFTPEKTSYQQMGLFWGVIPYLIPYAGTMEEMIFQVEKALLALTPVQPGQQVIVISGFPLTQPRPANFVLLHTVGKS